MYTEKELISGIGCYADRLTHIFTDGVNYATGENLHDCPPGFWMCGTRHPDSEIVWM